MSHYLKYYSDFKDRDNNSLRLEIYTNTNGTASEVKLLSDAMSIEYSADSIFQPLRTSGASINIFTEDLLTDIFSGGRFDTLVKIYRNSALFWAGFATPNIYSQSYVKQWDTLTLECIDMLAQLDKIDYTYINKENAVGIFSFMDVISHCIDAADPVHVITDMYVDNSISLDSADAILDNLYIKERNFFDEKEEPEKLSEVVSAMLMYLGLTMIQYKSAYYIISADKLHSTYNVAHYTFSSGSWVRQTNTSLTYTVRTPNQIGLSDADAVVSLDGVYNKVTIIGNNNPLAQVLPDFEDADDLVNQNADPNMYYTEDYTFDGIDYKLISAFFKSLGNWIYMHPSTENNSFDISGQYDIDEVTVYNRDTIKSGVFWQRADSYKLEDGEPSSLNWKMYITMTGGGFLGATPYLFLYKPKTMILDGGYLILNMRYKLSSDLRAHSVVKSMYDIAAYGSCSNLTWTSDSDNIGYDMWPENTLWPCRLKIGSDYYNGEQWISYDEYNAKVARGYYSMGDDNIHGYALRGGPGTTHKVGDWENWYRVKNSYGDWLYVTESQYNANSGTKEKGKTKRNNHFYYVNGNGDHVAMCIDYYYEIFLQDRFFLVHINKTTETIYDVDYDLTNTVSYRFNIVDSSDGMAVKCPDDRTLYGALQFYLYAPRTTHSYGLVGYNPQPRTDNADTHVKAVHISDLSIKYSKTNSSTDIFNQNTTDPDTIYTNIVSDDYCTELDDVTLKVNSANTWATSYSYAIGKNSSNDYYYIDALTFGSQRKKPEERLVERLVNYYRLPKYKFGRTVKNSNVAPFEPISETLGGSARNMVLTSATYNVSQNTVTFSANEI